MSRKLFTAEQQQLLRQNPYVYSVTDTRLTLTKEFKELFMAAYKQGESPRKILEDHGFDLSLIGERRIWGISQHIRSEYQKYGEFHEGYVRRSIPSDSTLPSDANTPPSDAEELRKLRHEIDYLKQEMEFLKKISSIRTTRK